MAATRPIQLDLPAALYERIAEAAARADRQVDDILVDTLALLFDAPALNWERLATTMDALSDAELWALAYRRAAWTTTTRLHDLTAHGQSAQLSPAEQRELDDLTDEIDRIMVLRSSALLVLQRRGHDIRNYLPLGA